MTYNDALIAQGSVLRARILLLLVVLLAGVAVWQIGSN